MMKTTVSNAGASTLWILLLTAASTATTLIFACATPFPALAVLAALHMRRGDGIALMGLAWLAGQLTTFAILGHPVLDTTPGWALGLAVAALASCAGASAALGRLEGQPPFLRLAAGYLAAFVVFKAVIFAFSLWLGDAASALDPLVVARQFFRYGAILVGLQLLYHALVALGLPAARRKAAIA